MSINQEKALKDLTDSVSLLERKLNNRTIDLETAKTSLAVLQQENDLSNRSNPSSDILIRPRRAKRDKSIAEKRSPPHKFV